MPQIVDKAPTLDELAKNITYFVPASITGLERQVTIRYEDPYENLRRTGFFVSLVRGSMNAIVLKLDGTWDKYGEPFDSYQAAYDKLLETPWHYWGEEDGY